jgi:hypothetical protein
MRYNPAVAIAGLALTIVGAATLASSARAGEHMRTNYCATGFTDARGHCQSDGPMIAGPCQPGTHFQVFPNGNGYRCAPDGF